MISTAFTFLLILTVSLSGKSAPLPFGPPPATTTSPSQPPPSNLPTSVSSFPWSVITSPDSRTFDYGHASLIGDVIVVAAGFNIMHYDTKTGNKTIYPVSKMVVDVFGDDASKQMWAVGSPPDDFNGPGLIWHFDGASSNASWKAVSLPFDVKFAFRAIHGTGPNNVWAVAGSGEAPPLTSSIVVHWDGRQWTKYLENKFNTGTSVFTRGNDVWVGFGDGMIIHTSNGFNSYSTVNPSRNGDHSTHQIWGPSDTSSPIYIAFSDGLKVIQDPACASDSSCLQYLTTAPDPGNTGHYIETIVGGFPGLPSNAIYTAGSFAWGGLWNGYTLTQDTTIPNSGMDQSSYSSLFVSSPTANGEVYLYGLVDFGCLVRKRVA